MRQPSHGAPATGNAALPGGTPHSTRRLRIALGTWVAIEAGITSTGTEASQLAAIDAAYAAIQDIDIRMHPRREGSEIAHINSTAAGTPVEIQPDTWHLLQLARRLYDLTDGVFDPCLPTRPGRLCDIEIQLNAPVVICHAPVELDLGGIAKGHAIDRAIGKLQESGCTSGLVNAGGDLRVFGDRAETVFLRRGPENSTARDISVGAPDSATRSAPDNSRLFPLMLQNAALAVSDLDARDRPAEHQGYYVRGHTSATSPRYAAVIAPTAAVSDSLTKCILLCSSQVALHAVSELQARSIG